ncbi:coiled-coil domain-containing protein 175 [Phyllostomus hastatus]|uniref:coiled-coil domain-containing protein 175 n=1 Tax=Phyllostomus hastatus TaxID=9423 RepID=UPI001E680B18|nr:coiled-coil domain-containing protein 175 [Phyllostomus hastatus]
MALHSWSPELGCGEKVLRPAAVSTGPSLELCTFPSSLGSSVADAALEQLLVVEQSLQGDYFKCNEEARIFLKDIAVAVKKLEEMRKATIDLLEIESMELSRLYFQLETLPTNVNTEFEECVRDARRLNLLEMDQLQKKITRISNEIEFLKKKILYLKNKNKVLGKKQEELARQHQKFVLSLNNTMGKKAAATIYINETYTKINMEKEEIKLQRKHIQDVEEQIEKERTEYLKRKSKLIERVAEQESLCELKRQDAYQKKKELDKLRLKEAKMKEKMNTTTVVLTDHNVEIEQLQEAIRHWEEKIEEIQKACRTLENKMNFFNKNKKELNEASTTEKNDLLQKIKEMAEKIHRIQLENKDLHEKLTTLARQCDIVVQEEDKVFLQKKKIHDENHKQLAFITQKENFLSQRKIDIKNMEEGLNTLTELLRATKEVYRKQIKILNDNLERERQRCVITQWKIACLKRMHSRWLFKLQIALQLLVDKIKATEARRSQLLQETTSREKEITEYLVQIEKITLELKQEEEEFTVKEKKLIQELIKYEEKYVQETASTKIKEDELVECLPYLQVAEEEFNIKNKKCDELNSIIEAQKEEQKLLEEGISQMTRDFARYMNNKDKVKEELEQLRDQENQKIKTHSEILRNLENEIYAHDLKTDALLLENKKLKKYIAYLKNKIQRYAQGEDVLLHVSSDLSWHLIAHHTRYLDLWAEFQITVKGFVQDGLKTLQEIKYLRDKLHERDEKVESISVWLQGNLEELRHLATMDPPEKKKERRIKKACFPFAGVLQKTLTK